MEDFALRLPGAGTALRARFPCMTISSSAPATPPSRSLELPEKPRTCPQNLSPGSRPRTAAGVLRKRDPKAAPDSATRVSWRQHDQDTLPSFEQFVGTVAGERCLLSVLDRDRHGFRLPLLQVPAGLRRPPRVVADASHGFLKSRSTSTRSQLSAPIPCCGFTKSCEWSTDQVGEPSSAVSRWSSSHCAGFHHRIHLSCSLMASSWRIARLRRHPLRVICSRLNPRSRLLRRSIILSG